MKAGGAAANRALPLFCAHISVECSVSQKTARRPGPRRRDGFSRPLHRRRRQHRRRGGVQHRDDRLPGDPHRSLVLPARSSRSPIRTSATPASTPRTSSRAASTPPAWSSATCRCVLRTGAAQEDLPDYLKRNKHRRHRRHRHAQAHAHPAREGRAERLPRWPATSTRRRRSPPRRPFPGLAGMDLAKVVSVRRRPTTGTRASGRWARATKPDGDAHSTSSPSTTASSTTSCACSPSAAAR